MVVGGENDEKMVEDGALILTNPHTQVSRPAAEAATNAKGSYGVGCGEEWMGWMAVIWALRVVSWG